MAQALSFGLDNIASNVWPQRLLRIKDWTSYESEVDSNGDAFYRKKKDKNPKYAIISYTWGRFRADGEWGSVKKSNAEAINVKGINWKIPRMDPVEGFSADKFRNILKTAAGDYDYVWVDVACINQNKPDPYTHKPPDTYNQIGCQASIFHKASTSFIWLHRTGKKDSQGKKEPGVAERVQALIDAIVQIQGGQSTSDDPRQLMEQRHQSEALINGLFHDPYFSSLWTLQESFLRKDASIVPKTGEISVVSWKGTKTPLSLNVFLNICNAYLDLEGSGAYPEILTAIKEAGMGSLIAKNPLVLLRASRHRFTTSPLDRVLGIQQIFGVDVGTKKEQLRELEEALSLSINKRCLPLAQAFVNPYDRQDGQPLWQAYLGTYTKPTVFSTGAGVPSRGPADSVRRSGGARLNGMRMGIEMTMIVPEEFYHAQEAEVGRSGMRPTITESSAHLLQFQGLGLPLEALQQHWLRNEQSKMPPNELNAPSMRPEEVQYQNSFSCCCYLDSSGWLSNSDQPILSVLPPNFIKYGWPLRMVAELCRKRPLQVRVLVLGKIADTVSGAEAWMGLLTYQGSNGSRLRFGFCTWKDELNASVLTRESCLLA